jgi:excisionase family DNA binding protein
MSDEILTKKEAAKYIKISVATIDRLMASRAIPFSKINGRVLFIRELLFKWVKSKRVASVRRFKRKTKSQKAKKIMGEEYMEKQRILRSKDGTCPYCGSRKVSPVGGFAARPSSSTTFPKAVRNFRCNDCKKVFYPPRQ